MKTTTLATLFVLSGTFFLFLNPVNGAQQNLLHRGERIRITPKGTFASSFVGTFQDFRNDTLYFSVKTRILSVPFESLSRLEVQRGTRNQSLRGAIMGGIAGGLTAGILSASNASQNQEGFIVFSPGQAFLMGCLIGAPPGLLFGALFGRGMHSPFWIEYPLKRQLLQKAAEEEAIAENRVLRKAKPDILKNQKKIASTRFKVPFAPVPQKKATKARHWSLALSFGIASSRTAGDVENRMRTAGFGDSKKYCKDWLFCNTVGYRSYPRSKTGISAPGLPWMLSLRVPLTSRLSTEVVVGNVPLGKTSGYHEATQTLVTAQYSVWTLSPLIVSSSSSKFILGLGPALFITNAGIGTFSRHSQTKLGGVVEMAWQSSPAKDFFLRVGLQARLMGNTSLAPFPAEQTLAGIPFTLKANYSHILLFLSVGLQP